MSSSSPLASVLQTGVRATSDSADIVARSLVPTSSAVAILSVVLAALYIAISTTKRELADSAGNKIPRGPRGFPIVGSFPFLTSYPELALTYWQKKFGPVYSLWLGRQLFVIVADPGVAKDLLVTNGAVFSSRKEMFVKSQLVFRTRGITATPYNDTWRKHRRIATLMLNRQALEDYTPVFEREANVLVQSLFTAGDGGKLPINPQPHAGRCSLNNMLALVYATRTENLDDPLVGTALRISREFMNCTGPVSNLIDFVEWLQAVPSPMRARGERLHQDLMTTYGGMIQDVRDRLNTGAEVPECLAKTLLQTRDEEEMDWTDMAILASAFMIGGVETTAAIMQWFAALIPSYPDIQVRAHEELDRVIGRSRLPTIEDEPFLPYVRAIIKEVERCRNPFWLGTPHFSTADFTTSDGIFIPKDTVVLLNTYAMHHDPARHEDPQTFKPERYFGDACSTSESANLADPCERDHWMFGAGRRICPGILVAEREIFLVISKMLWCFHMEEIPGEPIDLKEYDGLSGRSPVPFRIKCIPRHENVVKVLGV